MIEIRKTSTVNRSMDRAYRDTSRGLSDVVNYHLRQIEILYENRSEGYGEFRTYSRPVLKLRENTLRKILAELNDYVTQVRCEIEFIDEMLLIDRLTDDEDIIYKQKDRVGHICEKEL